MVVLLSKRLVGVQKKSKIRLRRRVKSRKNNLHLRTGVFSKYNTIGSFISPVGCGMRTVIGDADDSFLLLRMT